MSDVEKLEAELELAKKCETLEKARRAMHNDLTDEHVAAYRTASEAVVEARRDWRINHRENPPAPEGVARPETVKGKIGVS